jgi:glycosyltransferase involved in cell wall biosynthesis
MLAAMFAGINTRIHTVSGLRFVSESGFNRFLLLSMERLTAVAATHILVNGKSLQEKLIKDRISKSFKISLLGAGSSNGINLGRFTLDNLTPEVMDGVKKSIQFAPRLKYIICIGRIVDDKGINELVDVFLELNQIDSSLRLLLVGSYEDDVDPVMLSTKRKISTNPNILVTGWTSNVPYYLSLATLLVHPSHREGFPNALLQAGAMGCPIVCSEIAGNIDIVENQIGGLTFEVKNRLSLKNVLLIALSDDLQMQRYAAALKIIVVEKFNQPAFWKLLLQKYHSILDSK